MVKVRGAFAMTPALRDAHPGPHIKDEILPNGMSVTEAARLLDVGRPALSNLLNGNAALSPEMAARIERAFGANARQLMDMQAAHDAAHARAEGAAATTRAYVPPFLQFKANDIEDWASSHSARSRLAVLLRTLVHSTGRQLSRVDFPGNDDSERSGWDGFVEAGDATPWVPLGKSGWEFGVVGEVKGKADGDYAKSVIQNSSDEYADITYIFVTPRRWAGKAAWERQRRAEKRWKDVRVYDASDLEQWFEQSIPGQAWFAQERGMPSQGVLSLDACWKKWAADCIPTLTPALFEEAVSKAEKTMVEKLTKLTPEVVVITADSREEALAFLHCVFPTDRPEAAALRDRIAVFSQPGALTKLTSKPADFIPVITSRDVEKEFAPHKASLRGIVIYPRNTTNAEPDVTLEPLSDSAFEVALQRMGCRRDDIDRLSRESGRSLTVLRRRLSRLEAIRTPEWASDSGYAKALVPFMLAGAWNVSNAADISILSLLADDASLEQLEDRVAALLRLEDAPLWSIGSFRGLVSKIDVLFAIDKSVTQPALERFFSVAELVLSEDDPSLDLPEEKRWTAGLYGKTREISAALRDGIGETLVLLAVYGPSLLRQRLGIDSEERAAGLVRKLLSPLTARKLEAQSDDLPLYAEASPEAFLSLLEADLHSPDPQSLKLMRPASSGVFGRCPRTGLLWALENTAWAPGRLVRTVDILARLAETVIDDNWMNKPSASLSAIFRCWMPQTAADIEQRIAALEYLVKHHPKVAWPLCVEQFAATSRLGMYSNKPRWRPDGRDHGEPLTNTEEIHTFALRALELALDWRGHTQETLGDLVTNLEELDDEDQTRIWDLVDEWSQHAPEDHRAWLREKVRVSVLTRRARRRRPDDEGAVLTVKRASEAYDRLKPRDRILEHAWLFKAHWVDESADEIVDDELNYERRDQRIAAQRIAALRAVVAERGVEGALLLAGMGDAAGVVGLLLGRILTTVDEQADAIQTLLIRQPLSASRPLQMMLFGLLSNLPDEALTRVLTAVSRQRDPEEIVSLFVLAPFRVATWRLVESLGGDVETAYWRDVRPMWERQEQDALSHAVDRLLAADRPRAAFDLVEFGLKHVPPRQLFRLLQAITTSAGDAAGTYQLDSYRIVEAFKVLNQSGEIPDDDMAGLEFRYIDVLGDVLGRDKGGIPNLERRIDEHPEWFVQAVAFAFKRRDGAEDPEELREPNQEAATRRAERAYSLLQSLSRIPGRNRQGEIESERLFDWANRVRTACAELGRAEVCDLQIGKLFSKAPVGEDGVWPCEPVRDVIQRITTESLSNGIANGIYNARGIHGRGYDEGGEQERRLAAKYEAWARALEFTHPRVAKTLTRIVRTYEHEANQEDAEMAIRKRLPD